MRPHRPLNSNPKVSERGSQEGLGPASRDEVHDPGLEPRKASAESLQGLDEPEPVMDQQTQGRSRPAESEIPELVDLVDMSDPSSPNSLECDCNPSGAIEEGIGAATDACQQLPG